MQMPFPCRLAAAGPPSVRGAGELAAGAAIAPLDERRRRVLVVEDDADLRGALIAMLEDDGFHAVGAENGDAAFTVLEAGERPDVILLDLGMPVMDGWTFMSRLREMSAFASTPVAVMSAGRNLVRAPVSTAYLEKPVRREELLDVILRLRR
jgi:CheY-like chemotaxis protein